MLQHISKCYKTKFCYNYISKTLHVEHIWVPLGISSCNLVTFVSTRQVVQIAFVNPDSSKMSIKIVLMLMNVHLELMDVTIMRTAPIRLDHTTVHVKQDMKEQELFAATSMNAPLTMVDATTWTHAEK